MIEVLAKAIVSPAVNSQVQARGHRAQSLDYREVIVSPLSSLRRALHELPHLLYLVGARLLKLRGSAVLLDPLM